MSDVKARMLVSGEAKSGVVSEWSWGCPRCGASEGGFEGRAQARSSYRAHREKGCPGKPPWTVVVSPPGATPFVISDVEKAQSQAEAADEEDVAVMDRAIAELDGEVAVSEVAPDEDVPLDSEDGSILDDMQEPPPCFGHHGPEDEACRKCDLSAACEQATTAVGEPDPVEEAEAAARELVAAAPGVGCFGYHDPEAEECMGCRVARECAENPA